MSSVRLSKTVRLGWLAVAVAACVASTAPVATGGKPKPPKPPRVAALAQTPLVSGVTDTSAVLIVRTTKPATVVVHYGVGLLDTETSPAETVSGDDNGAHISLDGLLPESTYSYAVEIDGVLDAGVFGFTTFPSPAQQRSFTFVAFADQDTPRPAPAYAAGAGENPAFVLQLGDFSHLAVAGPRKWKIQDYWKFNLSTTASTPAGRDFSSAIAGSFPFIHIWDDHDYGDSDGDRTFKYRSLAMRAFEDDFPTYPLTSPGEGFWQSFRYAQAEVFVLDLRSERDPNAGRSSYGGTKSMLGATQKAWLLDGLLNSTATWKFIVSSSVWNPHSKPGDSWQSFPEEQQEIVDFIHDNSITGVIFMSGDIHSNGAIDDGTNSFFPEISVPNTNTESMTCTGHAGCGTWSEGVTVGILEGGYAKFSVTPDSVTIEAKGEHGEIRHSLTVASP